MKKIFLNNIAIIDSSFNRNLFIDLASILVKKHNSKLDVYCLNKYSASVYSKKGILFNSVNIIPLSVSKKYEKFSDKDVFRQSLVYERKFNKKYAWYSASNRILGRGFSPTAPNFPRFSNKKISLEYIAYYYNNLIKFWENEFITKKTKLLLCPGLIESNIGRKFGIINRSFNSSRYKSFYCWYTDEFWDNAMIQKQFEVTKYKKEISIKLESMPNWNSSQMREILKHSKLNYLLKRIYKKVIKHIYWIYLKKNDRNYNLFSEINYIIRSFFNTRFITGSELYNLNYLNEKKFIFFPLQVEPERNLQGNSPEFFNQHAALIDLSINLPSDTYLVVKEHLPSAGVRSKVFYNQLLRDYSNIVFVNAKIKGIDLIERSHAVATINGTAGLEASIIGKPVISFSKHNPYNFLPHVYIINDRKKIKDILFKIFNNRISTDKSVKDGQRYLEALKKISIDLPEFTTLNTKFSEQNVKKCYQILMDTLI